MKITGHTAGEKISASVCVCVCVCVSRQLCAFVYKVDAAIMPHT